MSLRAFLIAVASVAIALGGARAQEERNDAVDDPAMQSVEGGRAVVVGAYGNQAQQPQAGACFSCHGMDGSGDAAAVFPRLSDQTYKYLFDALRDYASGVRESVIMAPIAKALTDEQMRDVSAYYAAQTDAPYPPPPAVDAEVLQLGGALAAVGSARSGVQACMNCHGPDGVGLPPSYPYLAGQYALYLESQLMAWKNGTRKGDGLGMMEDIAKRLSEEEIRAVSRYYASLRPASVTPEVDAASAPGPIRTTAGNDPDGAVEIVPDETSLPPLPSDEACESYRSTPAYQSCLSVVLRDNTGGTADE